MVAFLWGGDRRAPRAACFQSSSDSAAAQVGTRTVSVPASETSLDVVLRDVV